jgi:hypothetical protein
MPDAARGARLRAGAGAEAELRGGVMAVPGSGPD